jgi:hypothetical protein
MSIWESIAAPIIHIIDKVIPDKAQADAAKLAVLQMQQDGAFKELELAARADANQVEVNKVEAASSDPFSSRWRPFIGWVCGTGLAVQFLLAPFFTWGASLMGKALAFPSLDMGTLLTLLGGLLGLGSMRTVEKIKGIKQ